MYISLFVNITFLYLIFYALQVCGYHDNAVGVTVVTLTSIHRRCRLGGQYSVFSGGYSVGWVFFILQAAFRGVRHRTGEPQ